MLGRALLFQFNSLLNPLHWRAGPTPSNVFLEELADDPKVAVVLALGLPFLSLSFGFKPERASVDAAARLIQPHLDAYQPWELATLLWGSARLGYRPSDAALNLFRQEVRGILQGTDPREPKFSPPDAAMLLWALAVLHALTPDLWAGLVEHIASFPAKDMDEVTLIHLYQAAMFADPQQIRSAPPLQPPSTASRPSRTRTALTEAVRARLHHLPDATFKRCEATYVAAARQPGFDGPYLVELSIMYMLRNIYNEVGSNPAYRQYFYDLHKSDLEKARKLVDDPYMLTKFRSEIASKRARQNTFTRQLSDITATIKSLGLYSVEQAAVEDGLVHVDIALPDYKIAIFLSNPQETGDGKQQGPQMREAKQEGSQLKFLDPEGLMLSGYAANETPGMLAAKRALLEELGWKCFSLTWVDRWTPEATKKGLILHLIDQAGKQHALQGSVAAMIHGALRGVTDDSTRFEKEHPSAGWHFGDKPRGR
ncbi:hypothetical protein WJX72_008179 [[Myrmecia] bisecta]|uniref:RAP domain-containing protein n=1 Tax=[Myrmecia] bisecta TaxID=41462 RepID=A0AAW1R869_9CHLO